VIYLYAYTNHKQDLDSLRRAKAIYDALQSEGIEAEILVNEYRAQLLGREWGLPLATTIETIKDIDAVASREDIVVIDSPEELEGKVLNYPNYFKKLIYINSKLDGNTFEGAYNFNLYESSNIISSVTNSNTKEDKKVFIYGDSDYEKVVVDNLELFDGMGLDLYWGVYFFVKYEEKLKKSFNYIQESEDYYKILQNYNFFATSNIQVALEAKFNKKEVVYLDLKDTNSKFLEVMRNNGIKIVKNLQDINFGNNNTLENITLINNVNKLTDIIKSNM